MNKLFLTTLLNILIVLVLSSAANANHTCAGKVLSIDLHGPGDLQGEIEGMGPGHIFCSLTQNDGNFVPETCKALASVLLTANATGKQVTLYFNNDANTSCNKGVSQNLSSHGFFYLKMHN